MPLLLNQPLVFSWREHSSAAVYHLEILGEEEKTVLSALLLPPVSSYRAPSWFRDKFGMRNLGWRVAAIDEKGNVLNKTRTVPLRACLEIKFQCV